MVAAASVPSPAEVAATTEAVVAAEAVAGEEAGQQVEDVVPTPTSLAAGVGAEDTLPD